MAHAHPPRRRSSPHSRTASATTLLTSSLFLLTLLSTSPGTSVLAESPEHNFANFRVPHFLQVKPAGIKAKKSGENAAATGAPNSGAGKGGGSGSSANSNNSNNNNNNNNNQNANNNQGANSQQSGNNNQAGKTSQGGNSNNNGATNTSPQQGAPTSMNPATMQDMMNLDLQTFTGALGGIMAPSIKMSGKQGQPFMVQQEAIGDFTSASMKTCDIQLNMCQQMANKELEAQKQAPNANQNKNRAVVGEVPGFAPELGIKSAFTMSDCSTQMQKCVTAQRNAPFQTFNLQSLGPDPNDPDFDLLCAP